MTVKIDKRRYLLVRIQGKKPTKAEFGKNIRKVVRYFFGETILVGSNFHIIDEWKSCFVVRSNHRHVDKIEAAITLLWSVDFIADIVFKSGTIKGLKRKYENLFETSTVST